jgi:hypothetical protein
MQLKQGHLFYILLGVLLLSSLGFTIKEGLENAVPQAPPSDVVDVPNAIPGAGAWGGADPTKPSPTTPPAQAATQGIQKGQVPKGDEDLYILKSSIVPPVCPKCPDINVCPNLDKTVPPCPPCGRCPTSSFKCKKVPDLKSSNTGYLPQPILTDFSQFSV